MADSKETGEVPRSLLCIVTGASRGLGRSISREVCVEWGCNRHFSSIDMTLVARDKEGLEITAGECQLIHKSVTTHVLCHDLSVHEEIISLTKQLMQVASKHEGTFTEVVLFANAGSLGDVSKPISARFDPKPLQQYFDLVLTANIVLTSWFISELKADKKSIIYISSLCAVQPIAGLSMYSTGKAGGHMLFKCIAEENPDVKVLVYSPGPLQTSMLDEIVDNMCFQPTRKMFTELKLFHPDEAVKMLFNLIREDEYKSGDYIDVYDLLKKQ